MDGEGEKEKEKEKKKEKKKRVLAQCDFPQFVVVVLHGRKVFRGTQGQAFGHDSGHMSSDEIGRASCRERV